MNKVYRIYVEDVEAQGDAIERTVNSYFDSFTVFHAVGSWKGYQEKSLVIEVIDAEPLRVYDCALSLKGLLRQDCVMVTRHDAESYFV